MNKRLLSKGLILLVGLFAFMAASAFESPIRIGAEPAQAADVRIIVDGQEIPSDVPPTIVDGRTLVPVRAVSESLQAKVAWHHKLRIVTVAKDGMVLTLQADKQEYQMNGRIHSLDVPVALINDRAMVPIRVISESLGADVEWDHDNYSVLISNGKLPSVTPAQPGEAVLQQYGKVRIKYNHVNIRQAPSTSSPIVSQAHEGDVFILTGRANDWFQIERSDRSTAYVADWLAEIYDPSRPLAPAEPEAAPAEPEPSPPEPAPQEPVVTPEPTPAPTDPIAGKTFASRFNKVNLRSGPGTSFDRIGQVHLGAEFKGIKEEAGWLQLDWQGKTVWVRKDLVTSDLSQINAPTSSSNGNISKAPTRSMSLIETQRDHGQASVSFNVGSAKTRVVSNQKETIVLEVDGIQLPQNFPNPVTGLRPFQSMTIENVSDYAVRISVTAEKNGYFRLDRHNERFSITAVAKHKNDQLGLRGKTIVLDPGHGNYSSGQVDPGAVSKHNGLSEIDFNTKVLMMVKEKLEAQGATVLMTRGYEPTYISLAQRAQLANDHSADVFLSLHGDSSSNTAAFGAGVWTYFGDARLTSAAQEDVRKELAGVVNRELAKATGRPSYVKYANFAVTRENKVPAILVEAAFLSNPTDAALLSSPDYQAKISEGLYQGLAQYFSY